MENKRVFLLACHLGIDGGGASAGEEGVVNDCLEVWGFLVDSISQSVRNQ